MKLWHCFMFLIFGLASLQISGATIQCYVGIGNASDPLSTDESADNDETGNRFVLHECGEPGSQLVSIEAIMADITEKIKDSWENVAEKAANIATSIAGSSSSETPSRRRRFAEIWRRVRRDANETSGEEDGKEEAEEASAEGSTEVDAKSAAEDENYACVKAMAAGTVYRSCVPKIGLIRLNCTSAFEQNVLCYCHQDGCNGSMSLRIWIGPILLSLIGVLLLQ